MNVTTHSKWYEIMIIFPVYKMKKKIIACIQPGKSTKNVVHYGSYFKEKKKNKIYYFKKKHAVGSYKDM